MATATVPRALFPTLYSDGSYWELPTPDYAPLSEQFGAGSAANIVATPTECLSGLAGIVARSPTMVAFVTDEDCDAIFVAHSLSLYPADYNDACALDGLLVGLIGDNPVSVVPVVFSQVFMGHCTMSDHSA
jgi:hypothetical protein